MNLKRNHHTINKDKKLKNGQTMLTPFFFSILNLLFMFYFIQIRQNMRTVQIPGNIDALSYQYLYMYCH